MDGPPGDSIAVSPRSRCYIAGEDERMTAMSGAGLIAGAGGRPTVTPRSAAQRAKECSQLLGQQLWLLEGREMTAARHLGEALDVVEPLRPLARAPRAVLG